jgi:hypothetical protein
MEGGLKNILSFFNWFINVTILPVLFTFMLSSEGLAQNDQQDPPPSTVTLENDFRITFLGVTYNTGSGTSTWRYLVEELPEAQDLSNWMLELFECHEIVSATPSAWWFEDPDPNFNLTGIKWQGAGVQGSAEFTVTLRGYWLSGANHVGAKGPDEAIGQLAGPSCQPYLPAFTPVYFLLHLKNRIKINEFMAANAGTLEDPDWLEIYNGGGSAVDLHHYYLSNDPSFPTKYQITENVVIPPKGFAVFYAGNNADQGPHHTNFTLDGNGGSISLFKADGTTMVDSYTYGTQTAGQSEGRCPDGKDNWTFFATPTPGTNNGPCN